MKNIITKKLILFLSIITGLSTTNIFTANMPNQQNSRIPSWHFDTNILKNTAQTKQQLIQEGFTEVDISTNMNAAPMPPEQLEQLAQNQFAQLTQIREAIRNNSNDPQITEIKNNPQILQQIQNATIEDIRNRINAEYASSQQQNQPATTIKGLYLERPNSRATIIFTPGFWPGNKETFAPFVKIAPQDCNLLFLELSGHGESPRKSCCSSASSCLGTPDVGCCLPSLPGFLTNNSIYKGTNFLLGLKEYGKNEHNEIIGAIVHAQQLTQNKPIILFGWCAGAFIAARTLIKLKEMSTPENDLIKNFNIQGLIFDSGFGSIQDIKPGMSDYIKKTFFKNIFSWISNIFVKGAVAVGDLLFGNATRINNLEINLFDKIQTISDVKTFFIHSTGDSLAPIEKVKTLANTIKQANPANDTFWETAGDCHAKNQLIHKEEYTTKLANWLNNTIQYVSPATQPETTGNNKSGNKKELNANIKRMLEIIDIFINCIKTNKQPDEKLAQEFQKLLTEPETGISADAQTKILEKLGSMNSKTPQEQIQVLEEIKEILMNINTGQESQQKNNADKDNSTQDNNKDKNYGPNSDYKAPQQYVNPNAASNTPPSNSNITNSNGPLSSGPEASRSDRSNSNGASSPSGSRSPSRSVNNSYNGGYGDGTYYGGSNKNDKENDEKPNLTAGEYFMLDEEYTEEMEDMPDRRNWFSR